MTSAADVFSAAEITNILRLKDEIKTIHLGHIRGNETFFHSFREKYVYAGGVFPSFFWKEVPKDIDFFILDDHAVESWFDNFLIRAKGQSQSDSIKEHDIKYMKNKHIKRVVSDHNSKIQYIFTDYKTREELMASFDYAHTKVSYYKGELYITKATYDAIRDKKLIVTNQENWYPQREEKFLKRGWTHTLGAWTGGITPIDHQWAAALMGSITISPHYTGWSAHSAAVGQTIIDKHLKFPYLNDITA
jgi:hypothetical protein